MTVVHGFNIPLVLSDKNPFLSKDFIFEGLFSRWA